VPQKRNTSGYGAARGACRPRRGFVVDYNAMGKRRHCGVSTAVCRAAAASLISGAVTHGVFAQTDAAIERVTREALDRQLGTLSVSAQPGFADGRLANCTVEYNVLAKDWVYKQGGYITVGGAFGLMQANGRLGAILKVILHDLEPRTMQFTPSPPASAYFVASNFSTSKSAVVASYPSDVPGAIFVVHKPDPILRVMVDGLKNNKLTIAFTRAKGASDLQIAIDTSVEDITSDGQRKRSPNAGLGFMECAEKLIKTP
jgi:hypothetical protein